VAGRWAGEQLQAESARRVPRDYPSESGFDLVVTDNEIVARLGVNRHSGMAQVSMHNPRLILLVVIHPQLHSWLIHASSIRLTMRLA
jgi:hypothetical protein